MRKGFFHIALMSSLFFSAEGLLATNPASTQYVQQNGGSTSGPTYTVGEYAQGGVIFWLTPDLQHGLAVSIVDISTSLPWSTPNFQTTLAGATANGLVFGANYTTLGEIDTALIVNQNSPGTSYAAGACAAYNGGGYTDWYLPSLSELGLIQAMKTTINNSLTKISGAGLIGTATYWSSFENSPNYAFYQDFSDGIQNFNPKNVTFAVRAVRAF